MPPWRHCLPILTCSLLTMRSTHARIRHVCVLYSLLMGVLSGVSPVTKTAVSEVCGKEHEVMGMSVVTSEWSISYTHNHTRFSSPCFHVTLPYLVELTPPCFVCLSGAFVPESPSQLPQQRSTQTRSFHWQTESQRHCPLDYRWACTAVGYSSLVAREWPVLVNVVYIDLSYVLYLQCYLYCPVGCPAIWRNGS